MSSLPIRETSFDNLVLAAKRGDREAIEALLQEPSPLRKLVASIKRKADPARRASQWEPAPQPGQADEADAAANLAILQALKAFDPERGVSFTTFAFPYIRGAILRALYPVVRRRGDTRPIPRLVEFREIHDDESTGRPTESILLDRDPDYGADAGFMSVIRGEQNFSVRRFVAALPDNQRFIVHAIYFEERTQEEIAAERGVSRQAISKSLNKALARGRQELDELDLVAA